MDQHHDQGRVVRFPATDERSTQLSTSFGKLPAVTPAEFAKSVSPLLTLVSPTGMTQDERKAWLHAAYSALDDIPAEQLAGAVREAMKTVDHPAKIIAAIRKAYDGPGRYQSRVTIHAPTADELRRQADERKPIENAHEMAELMRGLRERLEANATGDAA